MKRSTQLWVILVATLLGVGPLLAQDAASPAAPAPQTSAPQAPVYQPKFPGDPARSDSEAAAKP